MPRCCSVTVSAPAMGRPRQTTQFKKTKTKVEEYHNRSRKLISFLQNGQQYASGHNWHKSKLAAIILEKIMWYLLIKMYYNQDANLDKDPSLIPPQSPELHACLEVDMVTSCSTIIISDPRSQRRAVQRSAIIYKLLHARKTMKRRGKPYMAQHFS